MSAQGNSWIDVELQVPITYMSPMTGLPVHTNTVPIKEPGVMEMQKLGKAKDMGRELYEFFKRNCVNGQLTDNDLMKISIIDFVPVVTQISNKVLGK